MTIKTTTSRAAAAEEFLSGKLAQVDVVAIERELNTLWHSAAETGSDDQLPDVARACVLSLILYSRDEDAEISAGNLLDQITLSHPCRALLAIARPGASEQLDAWVSARCHLSSAAGSKQICCEQITVRFEGVGVHALPSVVIPLLVPDLPVFLWWRTPDFNRKALDPFLPAIDRLVIDSGAWAPGQHYFSEVLKCLNDRPEPPQISDLNWARLEPWRRLLAESFDSLWPDTSPAELETIKGVMIEYASPNSAQAQLMGGWLASRLSWQLDSLVASDSRRWLAVFRNGTRTVPVEWQSAKGAAAGDGNLLSVSLSLAGEKTVRADLQRQEGQSFVCAKLLGNAGTAQAVCNGPDVDEARLIGKELDLLAADPIFQETLRVVAKIQSLAPGF